MSQVDAYTIPESPLTMAQLASRLEALFDAEVSQQRGSTAPDNPVVGMLWWDTAITPIERLRVYRAAGWRTLLTLNVDTGELTWGSTVEIAQGGTGATTLAGAKAVLDLGTASELDWEEFTDTGVTTGSFTSGTIRLKRVGNVVTMTWSSLAHPSGAFPISGGEYVPAAFRPSEAAYAVYKADSTTISSVSVISSGQIQFAYRDYSGNGSVRTYTRAGSMMWHTD